MGHYDDWTIGSTYQWWYRRCGVVVPHRHHQLSLLHIVHGGNGQHGTYGVSQIVNVRESATVTDEECP